MRKFLLFILLGASAGYTQNNLPDPSFGLDGKATSYYGMLTSENLGDAVLLSNEGFYTIGSSFNASSSDIFIAKYTPGNLLDQTFGDQGRTILGAAVPEVGKTSQLERCSNDNLVAAISKNGELVIYKLTENGAPVLTFGTSGVVTASIVGKQFKDMCLFPDNSILVLIADENSSTLLKFSPDGLADTSFGSNGALEIQIGTNVTVAHDVIIANNNIWLCGQVGTAADLNSFAAKYSLAGVRDESFQPDIANIIDYNVRNFASKMAITSDSKIIVGGGLFYDSENSAPFYLVKLLPDGAPDNTAGAGTGIIIQEDYWQDSRFTITSLSSDSAGNIAFTGNETYDPEPEIIYNNLTKLSENFTYVFYNYESIVNKSLIHSEVRNGVIFHFGHDKNSIIKGKTSGSNRGNVMLASPFPSGSTFARDIDRLPNGKYIVTTYGPDVAQSMGDDFYGDSVCVMGFLANGQPDTDFGQAGKTYLYTPNTETYEVRQCITNDGGILISVGRILWKLLPNGQLDTTFGSRGMAMPYTNYFAHDLTTDQNNKILLIGHALDVCVLRRLSDGLPDTSFNNNGIRYLGVTGYADAYSLLSDGKILVSGYGDFSGVQMIFVSKLNPDGTFDTTFGTNGRVQYSVDPEFQHVLWMNVTAAGKILLNINGAGSAYIMQLNSDGTIDTSYATNGIYASPQISANASCLTANGDLIFGFSTLRRLNPDGNLDTAFGNNGVLELNWDGHNAYVETLKLQPDGKILAVGNTQSGGLQTNEILIFRLMTDTILGTIDFSSNESFLYPNPVQNQTTFTFELSKAEKITVALYDLSGKLLKTYASGEPKSQGKHDLVVQMPNGISAGNYILKISSDEGSNSVKLIKK